MRFMLRATTAALILGTTVRAEAQLPNVQQVCERNAAAVGGGAGSRDGECGRPVSPSFPDAWAGRWEGTLTTTSPPDGVRGRIPISLLIARADTGSVWTWRTVFNADTIRGLRPYRLLPRDVARGWFATDEGNGVELEETWVDGALIGVFQVGERVLESRYTVRNDTLVHDIIWWSATPVRRMRSDGPNGERGAEILSHRVEGRQRAVMVRATSPTGYR